MSNLSALSPASTYEDLLQVNANGQGLQSTPLQIQDGLGNNTLMSLWTAGINFDRTMGAVQLDGVALTASAAVLNNLSNVAVAQYVVVTPNAQLPNASVLAAAPGLTLVNNAPNYVITPSGELGGMQAITGTGLVVRGAPGAYRTVALQTDGTLQLTNASGVLGDPSLSVISDSSVQRVNIENNGVLQSTRAELNFIPSTNIGITINDDPFNNRTDIIISSTAAAGGVTSIAGTLNQIDMSAATGNVVASIDPGFLTAGSGISIVNVAGALTISANNSGNWVNQNTSAVTMVSGKNYAINNGGTLVTLTLPAAPVLGDTYKIVGYSSGGWMIAQNAIQVIELGNMPTTAGVAGYLASTNRYDCVTITYIAGNTFVAYGVQGNITVN
jgi:hypothetical protein